MENNSSKEKENDRLSTERLSISQIIKLNYKTIIYAELQVLSQIRNYLTSLFSKSLKTLFKLLNDINNKLNIYTQLKREYNFQNIMIENLIYMIGVNDGSYKSIIKILIHSEKKENQQNYFNC